MLVISICFLSCNTNMDYASICLISCTNGIKWKISTAHPVNYVHQSTIHVFDRYNSGYWFRKYEELKNTSSFPSNANE